MKTSRDYTKLENTGEAVLHRGDPRLPESSIDKWFNGALTQSEGASSRPYLYGSDAGLCVRKNVFHEHNTWIPSNFTPASTAYMAIGVGLENMLAEGLARSGRLVKQDTRLIPMAELKISGKIDLIVFDVDDELAIIEVKTCGNLPTKPDPKHLAQVQIYCAVSGIHKAWLTYISRTVRVEYGPELAIRSFAVDTSYPTLLHRLSVAAMSAAASKDAKVPGVNPAFRKTVECRYCPFLDFCWELEPRYRLGSGDGPAAPLQQYEPSEQLVVEDNSTILASKLMRSSVDRYYKTLGDLLSYASVTEPMRDRLVELIIDRGSVGA